MNARAGPGPLALTVGCRFGLLSASRPRRSCRSLRVSQPGLSISGRALGHERRPSRLRRPYGNRCERFELAAGGSQITYEARLVLARPADVIEPARARDAGGDAAR